jgi:hypothetical protein
LSAAVPASLNDELVVEIEPLVVGEVIAIVGAVASVSVAVKLEVAVLPAASRAVTVMTFAPATRRIPLAVQLAVPLAAPVPPRLLAHVTCVTPTLSLAVPLTVIGVALVACVADEVGPVIVTAGLVVSGAL